MEPEPTTLACKLATPEFQKRKATVITDIKAAVLERKEFQDGYSYKFEYTDEILDKLSDFVKTERQCCEFLSFQITIEGNTALLKITGPDRTKEFLAESIGL